MFVVAIVGASDIAIGNEDSSNVLFSTQCKVHRPRQVRRHATQNVIPQHQEAWKIPRKVP